MLKVGLIGAGFMGRMHATCYEALGGEVKIVSVADVITEKASKIANKLSADIYSSGDELIDNAEVDIIDICLPTYLHTSHAVKAMEKGKAVFIEKPVCLLPEEGKLLLETQKRTGAIAMVGQCIRFWLEYNWLKNIIINKTYGEVRSAVFTRVSPKPTWSWDGWILDPKRSGSVALDLHIHDTDYIRSIFGEPLGVVSEVARDGLGAIEQIITSYKYNGPLVTAEGAWGYPPEFPFSMEYRVMFEKATAVYKSGSTPSLTVYTEKGETLTPSLEKENLVNSDAGGNVSDLGGYFNELKYFTGQVKNNHIIEKATLGEAVKSFELVVKEIKSAGGQPPLY